MSLLFVGHFAGSKPDDFIEKEGPESVQNVLVVIRLDV